MKQRMHRTEHARFLLSPHFLTGVGLLLLNDFLLKPTFANALTGKLSDFAGLFVLPFFFAAFLPARKDLVYAVTAFFFCAWKSPFAQSLIDFVNHFEIIRIGRVLDYTDLIAVLILPVSYYVFDLVAREPERSLPPFRRPLVALVTLLSLFAFTATQFENERRVRIEKEYRIGLSRSIFDQRLRGTHNVSDLRIVGATQAWTKDPAGNVRNYPDEYSVRLNLKEVYCDSKDIDISFVYRDEGDSVAFDVTSVEYWCARPPTGDDKTRLISLFERAVVVPIGGRSQHD